MEKARLVIAISLPTRTFAALAAMMGAVTQGLCEESKGSDLLEEWLHGLSEDAAIKIALKGGIEKRGRFGGVKIVNGENHVILKERPTRGRSGVVSSLITSSKIIGIEPNEGGGRVYTSLPGRNVVTNPELFSTLFPSADVAQMAACSVSDCVIISHKSIFRHEFSALTLGAMESNNGCDRIITGNISELFGIIGLGDTRIGARAAIHPIRLDHEVPSSKARAKVAIFDGGLAYLHHRRELDDSNWLLLLDRSGTACDDAANEFRSERLQREIAGPSFPTLVECPVGMESVCYWMDR